MLKTGFNPFLPCQMIQRRLTLRWRFSFAYIKIDKLITIQNARLPHTDLSQTLTQAELK